MKNIQLINKPSSLEQLPRLGASIGLKHLLIKRDDEGGRGGGGNKLRKFERQMSQALFEGADTIVLAGHPQSNAAREIAATAASLGLTAVIPSKNLINRSSIHMKESGNALLLKLLGATIVEISPDDDFVTASTRICKDLKSSGSKPYLLPFGASDTNGVLGYVDCAEEVLSQCIDQYGRAPDKVFVSCGSGGTMAGLVAGFKKSGTQTEVHGVSILQSSEEASAAVLKLANKALDFLNSENVSLHDFSIHDNALGGGYGETTLGSIEMIKLCAQLEGLFLDPVYTGKAMHGLEMYVKKNPDVLKELIVFVHTGGSPLLFAYADIFK